MNKKFLSAILFGALMVTSTGTFVSCKDYDDEIDNLQTQIDANKTAINELKNLVGNGEFVTSISVNGQNLVVNTTKGSTNVALPACEGGTEAKVENGELVLDGKATGIKVAAGEAVKVVDGAWAIQQADGTYKSTNIPASGVTVVENGKGGYTLTVVDAEGESTEIELPATKVITDLMATTITDGEMNDAIVTLYYGYKVEANDGLTFNGTTYAKGTYLISQNSTLSAVVNPLDADATKYAFKLVDTKGNAPFVVSDIKKNMSEKALSRADKTANQGVWDMTLAFADATKVTDDEVGGTYALTAETANGIIASPYDVTISTTKVIQLPGNTWKLEGEGKYNTDFDLSTLFNNHDWKNYIVDYKFEITDKAAADAKGVTLNGNIIKTTKNETFTFTDMKVTVLFVTGDQKVFYPSVTFKKEVPAAELADIEWTITNETGKNVVYLSLASIQSQLVGNADAALPTMTNLGSTWADGTALNEKSVLVNGVNYGKADDNTATTDITFNPTWITSVSTQLYSLNADGDAYVNASTIQKTLYAKFEFSAVNAFPGEYIVNLGFKKAGATDYEFEVPVKVTIVAPTQTIVKYDNYFSGNNAVAYGTANGTYAIYKLTDLFKTTGLTFTETEVKNANNVAYPTWMTTVTEDGVSYPAVKVPVYLYGDNVDNTITVGSTREYTASIIPFDNAHIQKTEYTFNLTVKSAINEGTFSSEASKTIETSEPVEFAVTDFTATDVYGDAFYIANTYKYNSTNKAYTDDEENEVDDRITSVTISAADDNATNYLDFAKAFSHTSGKATDTFSVARKSGLTQLVADTECKLNVTILDKWGVKTTTTVTVVLKKFGN